MVARALSLLHQRYADTWSLNTLAGEVGVSRSEPARRDLHPPVRQVVHGRLQPGLQTRDARVPRRVARTADAPPAILVGIVAVARAVLDVLQ
jgi:hypothetical protein